jgi:hypothetical protein
MFPALKKTWLEHAPHSMGGRQTNQLYAFLIGQPEICGIIYNPM